MFTISDESIKKIAVIDAKYRQMAKDIQIQRKKQSG